MNRELFLHGIRQAIASSPGLRARSALPERPQPPAYGEGRIGQFTGRLEAHACTWEEIETLNALPGRVLAWLDERRIERRLAVAPPLGGLPWPEGVHHHSAPAGIDESVAVSLAFAGIAESGSLAMYSGPDSPITHNFVPEFHLIAIRAEDVCDSQEGVWAKLRARGDMPRALNLIAGPSRTGDVEQTIQLGAHGPRQVHVLLVRAKGGKS